MGILIADQLVSYAKIIPDNLEAGILKLFIKIYTPGQLITPTKVISMAIFV